MLRARRRSSVRLATILRPALAVIAGAALATGCSAHVPGEPATPAFSSPGRFVRDAVPVASYRSCCHFVDLTADTLWLDAGGGARRVTVFHDVYRPYGATDLLPAYDSTHTYPSAGTWQGTGAGVQAVVALGARADTLALVVRGDGNLQTTAEGGAVFVRR